MCMYVCCMRYMQTDRSGGGLGVGWVNSSPGNGYDTGENSAG